MENHIVVASEVIDIEIKALEFGKRRLSESFTTSLNLIQSCV
jgi:hypothetical protein